MLKSSQHPFVDIMMSLPNVISLSVVSIPFILALIPTPIIVDISPFSHPSHTVYFPLSISLSPSLPSLIVGYRITRPNFDRLVDATTSLHFIPYKFDRGI